MTFPAVRSIAGGSSVNGTTPSFLLPATIVAGDLILVFAGTDAAAALTIPAGYTAIKQDNATAFQSHIFAKVADGSEGGASVTGTLSVTESSCHIAMAIQGWSGLLSDVQASTLTTASSTDQANPGPVTASWGADDNLFIAAAIADFWNQTATAFPANYLDNQTIQEHQSQFGGTQAVSVATRNLAAASDDPSAFTLFNPGTSQSNSAYTVVIKPSAASGPTLSSVPETAFPGQSRTVTGSGFGPTQGSGGVTINGVAQTVTAWSDTSITFTTVQGNTKFGAGNDLAVTNDGAQTANGTIELIVEPGTGGYVDVVDPAVADSSSLAFGFEAAGGAPVATGDQCHYVFTGTPGDPTSMTVEPDTLVSALDQEGAVNVRFWDATDSTWGSFAALNAVVDVSVDPPTDEWPFGKGIRPTATANWSWGKRHPKTGMRTRIYK